CARGGDYAVDYW
nr:immunoglobulin heavy chain junction region [Mus musculus]